MRSRARKVSSSLLNQVNGQIPRFLRRSAHNKQGTPQGAFSISGIEHLGEIAEPLVGEAMGNLLGQNVGRVDQCDQAHRLTQALKLPGDLVRNHSAGAHAAQEVGALRLNSASSFDVIGSHFLDSGMQNRLPGTTVRLEPVDGVVGIQSQSQVAIEHRFAIAIVNQETGLLPPRGSAPASRACCVPSTKPLSSTMVALR